MGAAALTRLVRLAQEPFLHFLALGALIFLWHGFHGQSHPLSSQLEPDRHITITRQQISQFASQWQKAWDRDPLPDELDGLINDFVKEEVYYREALRLGLDRDDLVVRRRMRAKMEFLASAEIETAKPDARALRAWFDKNQGRYQSGPLFSFDQVFLGDSNELGAKTRSEILRAQLLAGADPRNIGAPSPLPASYERITAAEILHLFGSDLSAALAAAKPGEWTGPVRSGLGFHLVRVRDRWPGSPPSFDDLRQQIENDWRTETLSEREANGFQELVRHYDIRIEGPK